MGQQQETVCLTTLPLPTLESISLPCLPTLPCLPYPTLPYPTLPYPTPPGQRRSTARPENDRFGLAVRFRGVKHAWGSNRDLVFSSSLLLSSLELSDTQSL